MFNASSRLNYKGSNLESLIESRPPEGAAIKKESAELFAQALMREYPNLVDHIAKNFPTEQGQPPPEAHDKEKANQTTAQLIALVALALIASSLEMARVYGSEIDKVKDSNVGVALGVAYALIEFANACDVPFSGSEGGYRRYVSAYLVLRFALQMYGFLEPWQKYCEAVKQQNGLDLTTFFSDRTALTLLAIAPQQERPIIAHVLQGLAQRKAGLDVSSNVASMIPGFGALISGAAALPLDMALHSPKQFMIGQWSGNQTGLSPDALTAVLQELARLGALGGFGAGMGGFGRHNPGPASTSAVGAAVTEGFTGWKW
jgi:hypothetical protein